MTCNSCAIHLPPPPLLEPQVELVQPPADCKPGERLTFEGFPGEPDEQLNPKKKVSSGGAESQ